MPDLFEENSRNYALVAQAIAYIRTHALEQPALEEVASQVGMSDYHFQRMFSRWAGVSPKRFLQYITKEHAKEALRASSGILEASLAVGLSAPSRLHDLMVTCEAMTPGEHKALGAGVSIGYGYTGTPFGEAMIGWTARGVCYFEFCDGNHAQKLNILKAHWQNAALSRDDAGAVALARKIFPATPGAGQLHLVLRGTNFQIKVWEALLRTAPSQVVSYARLAAMAGVPNAPRAVGSALAANVVGYLIPCHRVIRESGEMSSYRWGMTRKAALLAWEGAQASKGRAFPGS